MQRTTPGTATGRPPFSEPSIWRLAWRNGLRDWRAGRWRLLLTAIALAVAALTAVGFFADRLQGGLSRDALALLGGDAVLRSDVRPDARWGPVAEERGLQRSVSLTFPTMARAPDENGGDVRLVAFKAVDDAYPLRGSLRVSDGVVDAFDNDRPVSRGPLPGTVWAEASVLDALGLDVGDDLFLGSARLRIAQVLTMESDRGGGFSSFSPRAMVNLADIDATQLVQPASRVRWRMAVAGDAAAVGAFEAIVAEAIEAAPRRDGLRIETLASGRPGTQETLDRAGKFLNLVAMLTALLCAVAVAIGARGFAASQLDACAMLRVLGLSQRTIARTFMLEFFAVGLVGAILGILIGWSVHWVFVALLAGLVKTALPAASWWPALTGVGVGLSLMAAFGVAPILQLAKVPPLRVMRRDVGGLQPASFVLWLLGVVVFCGLLLGVSRDVQMGSLAVVGFAVSIGLFAGLTWLAVRLLRRTVNEQTAPRWMILASRQVAARPGVAVVQVSALAVGLLALFILVLLRTDLIASWRQATPADAPTRFVINIQPDQAEAFKQQLADTGVTSYDWYPMIRGRLVAINGAAVTPDDYDNDRAQRLVRREFNLSHSAELPSHNEVTSGRWASGDAGAISIESGLVDLLGLKLGDTLSFDVAGEIVRARISDFRKVDWASMRVNFFAMFPVARMPDIPLTYISAFQAPESRVTGVDGVARSFDNQLQRNFPNITNIDTTATLLQVQRILDQVIRAIEFLFGFSVLAGLVVLFAAISHTRGERTREYAILRAMGARASLLRDVQRAELIGVGLLAGGMASTAAMVVGWALAKLVFEFPWVPPLWMPVFGALVGAVLAMLAGWWSLRDVLRTPAWQTLRLRGD